LPSTEGARRSWPGISTPSYCDCRAARRRAVARSCSRLCPRVHRAQRAAGSREWVRLGASMSMTPSSSTSTGWRGRFRAGRPSRAEAVRAPEVGLLREPQDPRAGLPRMLRGAPGADCPAGPGARSASPLASGVADPIGCHLDSRPSRCLAPASSEHLEGSWHAWGAESIEREQGLARGQGRGPSGTPASSISRP